MRTWTLIFFLLELIVSALADDYEGCVLLFSKEKCDKEYGKPLDVASVTFDDSAPLDDCDCENQCSDVCQSIRAELKAALRTTLGEHISSLSTDHQPSSPLRPIELGVSVGSLAQTKFQQILRHPRYDTISGLLRQAFADVNVTVTGTTYVPLDSFRGRIPPRQLLEQIDLELAKQRQHTNGLHADQYIHQAFIGQDLVTGRISKELELVRKNVPTGASGIRPTSFVFMGPPGLGKTYLARLMAERLGRELKIIPMSTFADKKDISSFIAPASGIHGEGFLFDFLEKNPDGVVVLDEVEKGPEGLASDVLLDVLSSGTITRKKDGKTIRIDKSIWILTSNCFQDAVIQSWNQYENNHKNHNNQEPKFEPGLDWITAQTDLIREKIGDQTGCQPAKNPFRLPELRDRIGINHFHVFSPYNAQERLKITQQNLIAWHENLETNNHTKLYWSKRVPEFIAHKSAVSVRQLEKHIESKMRPLMSKYLDHGKMEKGTYFMLYVNNTGDGIKLVAFHESDLEDSTNDHDQTNDNEDGNEDENEGENDKNVDEEMVSSTSQNHDMLDDPPASSVIVRNDDINSHNNNNINNIINNNDNNAVAVGDHEYEFDREVVRELESENIIALQQELALQYERIQELQRQVEYLKEENFRLRIIVIALVAALAVSFSISALLAYFLLKSAFVFACKLLLLVCVAFAVLSWLYPWVWQIVWTMLSILATIITQFPLIFIVLVLAILIVFPLLKRASSSQTQETRTILDYNARMQDEGRGLVALLITLIKMHTKSLGQNRTTHRALTGLIRKYKTLSRESTRQVKRSQKQMDKLYEECHRLQQDKQQQEEQLQQLQQHLQQLQLQLKQQQEEEEERKREEDEKNKRQQNQNNQSQHRNQNDHKIMAVPKDDFVLVSNSSTSSSSSAPSASASVSSSAAASASSPLSSSLSMP